MYYYYVLTALYILAGVGAVIENDAGLLILCVIMAATFYYPITTIKKLKEEIEQLKNSKL